MNLLYKGDENGQRAFLLRRSILPFAPKKSLDFNMTYCSITAAKVWALETAING